MGTILQTNEFGNIYTIGRGARNISIKKWKNNYFKIKVVLFITILAETLSYVMDKSKSKTRASVSVEFPYTTEVQCDISDILFVQNKDYQYRQVI